MLTEEEFWGMSARKYVALLDCHTATVSDEQKVNEATQGHIDNIKGW